MEEIGATRNSWLGLMVPAGPASSSFLFAILHWLLILSTAADLSLLLL